MIIELTQGKDFDSDRDESVLCNVSKKITEKLHIGDELSIDLDGDCKCAYSAEVVDIFPDDNKIIVYFY